MADSENTPTMPAKPNDDPALAMSVLWLADYDEFEAAARLASSYERETFDATGDARAEAKRKFDAAAKVRDRLSDKLGVRASGIFKTKAQSFEGAAAKLGVAIRENAPRGPDDPTPPWPALRSVQADLDRLVAATKRPEAPPS